MTILCVLAAAMLVVGCPPKEEKPEEPAETAEKPAEAPAEAPAANIGVTKDTITVGQWGPQTGPAALWGAVARGTAAYFEMINEEGGIHGRKLKLLIRDDSYQAPKTKAAVMELVEKENVFAFVGGVGTGPGMAVKDYLLEKKVPWIGPGSGSSKWTATPNRYLFSLYPQYDVETAKKNRIAFFYQNDDFGKEGLEAAKAELKARGLKLAAEVSVEMTDADLKSHILKLKQAKPQAVIMYVLPKHGAIALGTAAKMKFKPMWASSSVLFVQRAFRRSADAQDHQGPVGRRGLHRHPGAARLRSPHGAEVQGRLREVRPEGQPQGAVGRLLHGRLPVRRALRGGPEKGRPRPGPREAGNGLGEPE
jgi:ABC-type branched-subunit amino acid transport system substrate-binding protein